MGIGTWNRYHFYTSPINQLTKSKQNNHPQQQTKKADCIFVTDNIHTTLHIKSSLPMKAISGMWPQPGPHVHMQVFIIIYITRINPFLRQHQRISHSLLIENITGLITTHTG